MFIKLQMYSGNRGELLTLLKKCLHINEELAYKEMISCNNIMELKKLVNFYAKKNASGKMKR